MTQNGAVPISTSLHALKEQMFSTFRLARLLPFQGKINLGLSEDTLFRLISKTDQMRLWFIIFNVC